MTQYLRHKKVLVFGGSGFIGSSLVQALVQAKAQVVVADKNPPQSDMVEFRRVSIDNPVAVRKLLKQEFALIYNLAAQSGTVGLNPTKSFQINCLGALNLLEAAVGLDPSPVIVLSNSRQEYGKPEYLPVDEHHSTKPINLYGVQKLTSTQLALFYHRVHQLNTVIFRTSNVYGPTSVYKKQGYNVVNQWIHLAKIGKAIKVFGTGAQLRDYLYIDDLVSAFMSVNSTTKAHGKVINIGYGKGLSLHDMAQVISKHFDVKVATLAWPPEWKRAETGDYITDIATAKRILSWKPTTTFSQGIKKIIKPGA